MKSFLPIILIIVSVGLFFFQINPLYSEVKHLNAESRQYDEALETAEELKEIRSDLTARLESFPKADLDKLDRFLPQRLDTIRIILDMDGIAARNGIRLEGMDVSDAGVTKEEKGTSKSASAYSTVGISFTFSATYDQGVQFIEEMQKSLRLLDITSLSVRPSVRTSISNIFYDFDVDLQTYWINR